MRIWASVITALLVTSIAYAATTIQFKRGVAANLPATANECEPLCTTDTRQFFIGYPTGRQELLRQSVFAAYSTKGRFSVKRYENYSSKGRFHPARHTQLSSNVRSLDIRHRNYSTHWNPSTWDARYAVRGSSAAFNNLAAISITAASINIPANEEGNSIQLYQPIDNGLNSVTFKPYSTLTESLILTFAQDGIYRNISGGSRTRKVLSW